MSPQEEPLTIALHPVLVEPFKQWLAQRNCHLSGPIGEGAEAFHVVVPDALYPLEPPREPT